MWLLERDSSSWSEAAYDHANVNSCWEMYGISFECHPGLRHIYLPAGFEGNPLRKDYPLLARRLKPWPGIVDVEQMPGDDDPADAAETTEAAE